MIGTSEVRHRCVQCGAVSPQTETEYTLISARHGWRLAPRTTADGQKVLEWRCPTCWTKYRDKSGINSGP